MRCWEFVQMSMGDWKTSQAEWRMKSVPFSPSGLEDMLHFINLVNWYTFYRHILIQENWQCHQNGKSLLLQINELSSPLSPPRRSRIIWRDKREPNPHSLPCASIMALSFHKGALELNKIKDRRHTSYMVYGTLTLQLSCSLRSWECMITGATSVPYTRSWVFLVTLSSVFLLKTIMLSCSKIIFPSANDNTGLTRSGVFTFACVCTHMNACSLFGQDLTWVLPLLKDVKVLQNNAGGKCTRWCAVLFPANPKRIGRNVKSLHHPKKQKQKEQPTIYWSDCRI